MTDKILEDLKAAVNAYLGANDSASVTTIERDDAPDMALVRVDVLEALKLKAAHFDALSKDEGDADAFSILNEG